jgi:hypothetical protein
MTFHTFTKHFFAEKCTLPLPDNDFENSFSCYLVMNLCQLLIPKEKNAPVTLLGQSY